MVRLAVNATVNATVRTTISCRNRKSTAGQLLMVTYCRPPTIRCRFTFVISLASQFFHRGSMLNAGEF